MTEVTERLRIDKWLWVARFYKTRSLAAQAVEAGRARLDHTRVKSSREVKPGDTVTVRAGELEWTVEVLGVAEKRGPASAAALLYREGEESRARRELMIAARRSAPQVDAGAGRPTKKDRRLIRKFTGGE